MVNDLSERLMCLFVAGGLLCAPVDWNAIHTQVFEVYLANDSSEDLLITNNTRPDCPPAEMVFLGSRVSPGDPEAEWPSEGASVTIKPGQTVCLRLAFPRQGEPEPEFTFFQRGWGVGLLRYLAAPQGPAMALERHPPDLWEVGQGLSFRYCGSTRP